MPAADLSCTWSFLHLNVQCFRNKSHICELLAAEHDPDFFCLSEHWVVPAGLSVFNVDGYVRVAEFCRSSSIHGGTAIFVRQSFAEHCRRLTTFDDLCVEMSFECSCIAFDRVNCLVCLYRSPAGNFEIFANQLCLLLSNISKKFEHIFICGDMNVDGCKPSDPMTRSLHDIIDSFGLTSMIKDPTRVFTAAGRTSSSSVDFVITSAPNLLVSVDNFDPGISDHHAQLVCVNDNTPVAKHEHKRSVILKRNINSVTMNEFRTLLTHTHIDIPKSDDINTSFNSFISRFRRVFELAFPLRKRVSLCCSHNKHKYKHSDIVKNKLNELSLFATLTPIDDDRIQSSYVERKKSLQSLILSEKSAVYMEYINSSSNKSRTLWKIVNSTRGNHKINCDKGKSITLFYDERYISDKQEIVNTIGDYFTTGVSDKLNSYFSTDNKICTTSAAYSKSLFFHPVTDYEMLNTIHSLKNKRCMGTDDIPIDIVKFCADVLSPSLVDLINMSLMCGTFPDALKTAKSIPIYKKGDRVCIDNYRLISILSVFSKIFEKIISVRIENFIEGNGLMSPHQYGFRKGFSTSTASIDIVQHINDELDDGKYVYGVFFDLTKAFDSIEPCYVAEKLDALGIRGPINSWVSSFLRDRSVVVELQGTISNTFRVDKGTPQGSTLGPLIFLLFVNDLPEFIHHGRVFMYADDTSIVVSDKCAAALREKILLVMAQFEEWCSRNRLLLNFNKTKVIEFANVHKSAANISIMFQGSPIERCTDMSFLGTILDSRLNWSKNIDVICERLNKAYFVISSLCGIINIGSLMSVYYALVYSVISYSIMMWGQASQWHRVFVLQKRILRRIYGLPYRESCRGCFGENGILTVPCIYILKALTYIHARKHSYVTRGDIHEYETRHRHVICMPQLHHSFAFKAPCTAAQRLYNLLPNGTKCLDLAAFKREMRNLLSRNVFYSVGEFVSFVSNSQ